MQIDFAQICGKSQNWSELKEAEQNKMKEMEIVQNEANINGAKY